MRIIFILVLILAAGLAYAAPTVMIRNGHIASAWLAGVVQADPCQGVAVGDPCPNGVLYAGTGFAGLGSYKYMTTPGHCTNSVTPTCNGATDFLQKAWANNSGTTANGVSTGATSNTDGASNTTILAANYTDTDAAKYCENMTYPAGGYTDWYLPSTNELNLVLYAMAVAGKGNFDMSYYYWSSTEWDSANTWYQYFVNGSRSNLGWSKTGVATIRCVRKYL